MFRKFESKRAIHNQDLISRLILWFCSFCVKVRVVSLYPKNIGWLILTALSAPKEYWLDIATIGLCFYFIRMIK